MKIRNISAFAALSMIAGLATMPAFADEADDAILKAQTQYDTLNSQSAAQHAATAYSQAKLRIEEARAAENSGDDTEAMWRAEEASLQTEIAMVKIEVAALQRTENELRDAVKILRQEAAS